jgi:hypothetical protein
MKKNNTKVKRTSNCPKKKRSNSTQDTSLAKKIGISFAEASPTMFFRTFILFCALTVATIAILHDAFDVNVWTFLANVLMYAALTKGQ